MTAIENFPEAPTSYDWGQYLRGFGVPFKFGMSPCHWNVIPPSNFHVWSEQQERILVDAIEKMGYKTSKIGVQMANGRFYQTELKPGRGIRII